MSRTHAKRTDAAPEYLSREFSELPNQLADGEVLLDVEPASIGFSMPGLLAITDSRLIHIYFRRLLRRFKVRRFPYDLIRSIEVYAPGASAELRVVIEPGRTVYIPLRTGQDRARQLENAIATARQPSEVASTR